MLSELVASITINAVEIRLTSYRTDIHFTDRSTSQSESAGENLRKASCAVRRLARRARSYLAEFLPDWVGGVLYRHMLQKGQLFHNGRNGRETKATCYRPVREHT